MQDLLAVRDQMSGQVNVEVDATPQVDLTKVMEEMREHYEGIAAKNRKELDHWYQAKVRAATCTSDSPQVRVHCLQQQASHDITS